MLYSPGLSQINDSVSFGYSTELIIRLKINGLKKKKGVMIENNWPMIDKINM